MIGPMRPRSSDGPRAAGGPARESRSRSGRRATSAANSRMRSATGSQFASTTSLRDEHVAVVPLDRTVLVRAGPVPGAVVVDDVGDDEVGCRARRSSRAGRRSSGTPRTPWAGCRCRASRGPTRRSRGTPSGRRKRLRASLRAVEERVVDHVVLVAAMGQAAAASGARPAGAGPPVRRSPGTCGRGSRA